MPNNRNSSLNIYFDTLGCAKNHVDTSKMEQSVIDGGHYVVEDPKISDVIVINTCAFIEASAQESIDTFFEYKNYYKDKKIIIAGCLPSRYKEDLTNSLPEADAFIPCNDESKLVEVIRDFNLENKNLGDADVSINIEPLSYVKISEGCNRYCSYCTIPYIRGKYVSYKYEDIKQDVKKSLESGAKEIVLVAQDCGVWGSDFQNKRDLVWLLKNLSADFKDVKFRILYLQPQTITKDLLETIKSNNNIIKYLDIPLQHCNNQLLKSMNRKGDSKVFLDLLKTIREIIPECTLRTTFIVGFPGETDEQFDELCDFVKQANFDYAGIFEYSKEEGTKAYNLKNQISDNVKYSRANILRDICDNISLDKLNNRVGKRYKILIEGKEDGRFYGRAYFQAPEVDGFVYISKYDNTKNVKIGQVLDVEISDTEAYDLVGNLL